MARLGTVVGLELVRARSRTFGLMRYALEPSGTR